jgi:Arc/MetJ-type ribon-helix-helix transcriptional regulator
MKPIRYTEQINVGITEELRAELERLSEGRKESISEIVRRGIEAEVARLKSCTA